jgi:hypothetical protein
MPEAIEMSGAIIDVFRSLKLRDCGRRLPASAVADWERSIGLQLPANYRRFLEVFNGGKFYPKFRHFFPIDMSVHPSFWGDGIGGFTFYGLNEPLGWRDLERSRDIHEGRIPAGTVPIADAPKDLILLDCRRGGQIALWQRSHEGDTEPEENRIPLADSFLEFAQGIQEAPQVDWGQLFTADEEPFISIQHHDLDGLKTWVAENGPLAVLPDGGLSLLKEACSCFGENYDAAEWLLREGVDPTGPLERGVKTPLQLADEANCGDIIVLLLEHGANPEHLLRDNHQPRQYNVDFAKQWQAGERTSCRW